MIGFLGFSHLAINTAIGIASRENEVCLFANDKQLKDFGPKNLPIYEPQAEELYEAHQKYFKTSSHYSDLSKCEIVYLAVDIKTDEKNNSDLSSFWELLAEAKPYLADNSVLVIHSQVLPGVTRDVVDFINNSTIEVIYQVETLIFGRALERVLYPERYIIGLDNSGRSLPENYKSLLEQFSCPLLLMNYESAELAKISINMYLVSSVSVTNMLAEICEKIGAHWPSIEESLRLDKRIGQYAYLKPGLGISGGNLERDMVSIKKLSARNGTDSAIIDDFFKNSFYRKDWVLQKVFNEVCPKTDEPVIGILGLAYRPDTHSVKNSPSLELLKSLRPLKGSLKIYDPQVKSLDSEILSSNMTFQKSAKDLIHGCDALIIMTPWSEFKDLKSTDILKAMKGNTIIDPFGVIDKQEQANHFILGQ